MDLSYALASSYLQLSQFSQSVQLVRVKTGRWVPTGHGGSWRYRARKELEHAGLGLGITHIKEEARGSRLGPDCTGNKTRGPELGLRPARTEDEAMANRLGVGSARIGDEPRGLGHGPGPARIGDERRGLGLGFALALLALRVRRRALGACVLPCGPPACSSHFNVQEC